MGNWLGLRLDQDGPNHDAIGSWWRSGSGNRSTVREVTVGGGHAGGQLGWIHFGLGDADRAEVRVTWPDGGGPRGAGRCKRLRDDRRGAASASRWEPAED